MEEKMMILKMLQEGKITSEEALKLLEAVEKPNARENRDDNSKYRKKVDEGINDFTAKAERAAEQMEFNSEKFAEDFAKRVENVSTDIASAAVKFADKMMKYFNSAVNSSDSKYELCKTYSFDVENPNELELLVNTSNFHVKVEAGDVSNIQVNVLASSFAQDINIDDCLKSVVDGSKHSMICQFPDRTWGKINITIPSNVKSVDISTSNAKCELTNINSSYIKAITSNGKIEILGCRTNGVEAMTDNSKILFENCVIYNMAVRTSNGKIEVNRSKLDNITAKTSNSSIQIDGVEKSSEVAGKYSLYTSNGKIDIKLNPSKACGYLVDAHTTMGNVNVKLPGMVYSVDKKNLFSQPSTVIKNDTYDQMENKLDIVADTSNASIIIQG